MTTIRWAVSASCMMRCSAACAWSSIPACMRMSGAASRRSRYFADNAGDPESAATTEVERYCVWPGQACSYMLGKLEFLKQRERAEDAPGRAIRHPQIP